MKPKEIPPSLFRALQLQLLSPKNLHLVTADTAAECIVSLTSIESRLGIVHLTIRSLLAQTLKPEKVVLWLNDKLKTKIPSSLKKLTGDRFEIRFSDQNSAHRKLVESLRIYPEKTIITCDDDQMYHKTWLQRLWQDHKDYPRDIIAHEAREISWDKDDQWAPYKNWPWQKPGLSSPRTIAIGFGGVLYPANIFDDEILNREKYEQVAPRADDLWFKAMSIRNGITYRRSTSPPPKPLVIVRSQKDSLQKHNVRQDGNLEQWLKICALYGIQTEQLMDYH
ncbi:glycosyltransferase [Gynuella sp.]|uniref:glycosyltransferase n=1 Tax=Gynuella sp. TaxID=2969146 RepID=UPI003D0EF04B